MHALSTFMSYVLWGAPVWAWLSLGGLLLGQELIARSRWKSNTWVQLFTVGVLERLRSRFPALPDEEPKPRAPDKKPKRNDKGVVDLVVCMAVALLGLWLALAMVPGCATASTAQITALRADAAASQSLSASYGAWRDFDRLRQQQILDASPTRAEYTTAIASWRAERDDVDSAFADARDALAAYHQGVMAAGDAQAGQWTALLGRVVFAYSAVAAALNRHGVHLPGPSAISAPQSVAEPPAPCRDEERERWCPQFTLPEVA